MGNSTQRRDSMTPERDAVTTSDATNAQTVSGLYRLSADNKLPYVHRAENAAGSAASGQPVGD